MAAVQYYQEGLASNHWFSNIRYSSKRWSNTQPRPQATQLSLLCGIFVCATPDLGGNRLSIIKQNCAYISLAILAALLKSNLVMEQVSSTPNRTPISSRSYLNVNPAFVHTPLNISADSHSRIIQQHSQAGSQNRGVIYGTTIDTNQTLANLERFILEYEEVKQVNIGGRKQRIPRKIYLDDLKALFIEEERLVFNVSGSHIKEFDQEMYYQFIYFPAAMITCFDHTLKNMFRGLYSEETDSAKVQKLNERCQKLMVDISSLDEISILRNLSHKEINKLVMFKGIVIRCSDLQPEMKAAYFRCINCRSEIRIILENAKVQQPKECQKCKGKSTMELIHNQCIFTDKQFIKFQELPQYVPEGETPQSITVLAYDSNVDKMKPGDRVQIVAIYRAQPLRIQRARRAIRSVFNTYADLISCRVVEDDRYKVQAKASKQEFDDEERKSFFQAAKHPNIIDRLVNSFAPSIFGNEEVKKGILALLFGGSEKKFSQTGHGRFRSDINILLVGDPSTAKSQLLQQVHKIAPRGVYTSGRGSSAVGLTANVRRDPETKEFVLESGALVMSDMGVCCIDEFDKMDDNNKTILLEVMQQQTISVAKAGIVCSLKSRTSIVAAANPIHSRYDIKKSVVENINLPPSLLSRFDLIYLMLDRAVESYDTKLAHHILDIYSNKRSEELHQGIFSKSFLTNYITFAKLYIHPYITESAATKLSEAYVNMRSLGMSKKTISATPRQLESLIRLSEAIAKMRLSQTVEESDVEESINLMRVATQQSATDPTTGCIDMDVLATGRSTAFRVRINEICSRLKEHIKNNVSKYRKGVNYDFVMEQLSMLVPEHEQKVSDVQLREALKTLVSEDTIITYGNNKLKPSVKLCKDNYADR